MKIDIIRAGLQHLPTLTELFDAYRQFYGRSPDLAGAREFLGDRLRHRQSVILLALRGGDSPAGGAGFVQLYPSFSSVGMTAIWLLNDLYVVQEFRRQGIAGSLLRAAQEMARATNANRIRLSTAKGNSAARSLYIGMGYQISDFDQLEIQV